MSGSCPEPNSVRSWLLNSLPSVNAGTLDALVLHVRFLVHLHAHLLVGGLSMPS